MNFFGIGNMELLVILVVALLVLGPARMMDMARSLGRFWGEAQRTIRYAMDTATVEEERKAPPEGAPRDPIQEPEDAVARPARYNTGAPEGNSAAHQGEPSFNGHVPSAQAADSLPNEDEQRRG